MIKLLKSSLREYKKDSFLTAFYVILEVLSDIAIPVVTSLLIRDGIEGKSIEHILKIGAVLAVLCVVSLLFGILAGNKAAVASSGLSKNLRTDMFGNIQTFAFKNIDKYSSASMITRLTTDINNIQMAYQMIVRIAVRSPLMILFATVVSLIISPKLGLIYLIVTPIAGFLLYFIIKKVHPIFIGVFEKYDVLNKRVQENIHGIRVVKSFVQEDREVEKFSEVSEDIYQGFSKAEKMLAFNNPVLQTAIYICMIFISWFGAKLVAGNSMDMSQLNSMITYTMNILMNLMMLSMVFVMIVTSKNSVERCNEILEEQSTLANPQDPILHVNDATIEFKDVAFRYNFPEGENALSGINLTFHPGEMIGILGGTGSSKTSLVQLIPRLYDATEGSVTVGGINVKEYDLEVLRDNIAMVLQKNTLFSGTIAENLRWGKEDATLEEMRKVCAWAQAGSFIDDLPNQYESRVEQGGRNFSGGQQQRLCIARALLKKPKILILDDSTSAVDTKTDAKIRAALRDQMPDTTKIIIAQRIASVQDADKIVVLNDGRIDSMGTHEELIATSTIYQEVYRSQVKEVFGE